jgi:hypothetical protein
MPSNINVLCLFATFIYIESFTLQRTLPLTLRPSGLKSSTRNEDVEKLRQKVASIRAEIAQLEGKTVEEVTKEAIEKEKAKSLSNIINNSQATRKTDNSFDRGRMIDVPQDIESMIFQAARAVEMAYRDGIKRQTVRLALVTEGSSFRDVNEWPGGAKQMYREAAKPLTTSLLREIRLSPQQSLPPSIISQDIWDFDGSALLTAEGRESATSDVQALVFPNTDIKYVRDIAAIDESAGDRLFLLINPFWRNIDSWGFNLLAPGAKTKAQTTIFDKGYDETYVYLRFSVRGEDCVAIKCYPYDWQIFAYGETDSGWERPIRLGSSKTEPKSEQITELLNMRSEFRLSKTMRRLSR